MDRESNEFYRGLYYAKDNTKILIFASQRILKLGRNNTAINIQSDGTFKTRPSLKDVYQVFIISIQVGRNIYPILYALMEKKTTSAYETVFELLKWYLPSSTIVKSMTDYEYAIINAVKKTYPNCQIRGCFFHFAQAIKNNASKLGLYRLANEENTIKCGINYAKALALLPSNLIPAGIDIVKEKLNNTLRCRNFISYLKRQWLNKKEVCIH